MDEKVTPKLRHRRKVQLARVLAGDSITEASKVAGYSSVQAGSRALADTRTRIRATMVRYGLTEDTLIRDYLMPLLNATRTQFFAKDGIVTDDRTVEDNATRRESLHMAFQLAGSYPKDEGNGGNVSLQVNISSVGALT